MFLEKIEIIGFKSFYKKTTVFFPVPQKDKNGITAIVGPNGSGKSNICDALKWGLGVKSKKSFRTKNSKDIIFAGSPSKKPLSSALVSLYFDNTQRKIPIEYEKVVVSRKVFADGTGEYFINENRVKLKDVLHLLGQAGVGEQSYCVVDQGMADRLLQASPQERKSIIEEAAKVKPFQIKKEIALKKLEKAQVNLDKSADLAKEILPRLKNLENQANKKIAQEKLEEEFKDKAYKYYGIIWNKLTSDKENYLKAKQVLDKELKELENFLEKSRKKLTEEITHENKKDGEEKLKELQEKLVASGNEENELSKKISIMEGKNEIIREKINYQESISEEKVDLEYVKNKLDELLNSIEKIIKTVSGGKKANLENFSKIKKEVIALKNDLIQGVIRKDNSRIIKELEVKIKTNEESIKNLEKKLNLINQTRNKIKQEIAEANQEEENRKKAFYDLEKDLNEKSGVKDKVKDRVNFINIELARIEEKESGLKIKIIKSLKIAPQRINYQGSQEVDLPKLGDKIEKIQRKIDICDSIDQGVVDEYTRTKERYDFLFKESRDLNKSIVSLKKMVKNLEERIDKKFNNSFEKINKNFSKFFKILFKGGTAKLSSIKLVDNSGMNSADNDQDNKPDSAGEFQLGIEIEAFPPKKKIKNLEMLSGGEKTLTSLALLFAIIGISNPPFVMLDEVDAALDESNSLRFAHIIKEMAQDTQFILITHNREVMKEARILYGVTMQQEGLSSLVSLDLEK